jgi:hypothetical protein
MSRDRLEASVTHSDHAGRAARLAVYGLFILVAGVALDVPLYNRVEPAIHGVPFFYWFQAAWVVVTALATFLAYWLKA